MFSTARQLPCGHCFHGSCLRLWLEQDATCPTCRRKLSHEEEVDEGGEAENDDQAQPQPVWQFNLRRISRWLPSLQGLFPTKIANIFKSDTRKTLPIYM